MKLRHVQLAASAALALAIAAPAFAQQAAAPAAPAPRPALTTAAPPIPGMCVFSHDGAVAGSKLGQYIDQRLDTIGKQTDAELQTTGTSLQNDAKAADAARPSMSQEAFEQKALEIRQRSDNFQRLQQVRQREMQMTAGKALQRFDAETSPLVELAIKEKNCAILIGDGVLWVNQAMDLTPSVIAKLDSKITEFAFDRERLDQQLAAQGGAAPAATGAASASRPVANPAPRPAAPAAAPRQQPRGR